MSGSVNAAPQKAHVRKALRLISIGKPAERPDGTSRVCPAMETIAAGAAAWGAFVSICTLPAHDHQQHSSSRRPFRLP